MERIDKYLYPFYPRLNASTREGTLLQQRMTNRFLVISLVEKVPYLCHIYIKWAQLQMCKKRNEALFRRNFAKLNSLEERGMYKECVICMFVRKCTFLSKIEIVSSAKKKYISGVMDTRYISVYRNMNLLDLRSFIHCFIYKTVFDIFLGRS